MGIEKSHQGMRESRSVNFCESNKLGIERKTRWLQREEAAEKAETKAEERKGMEKQLV